MQLYHIILASENLKVAKILSLSFRPLTFKFPACKSNFEIPLFAQIFILLVAFYIEHIP